MSRAVVLLTAHECTGEIHCDRMDGPQSFLTPRIRLLNGCQISRPIDPQVVSVSFCCQIDYVRIYIYDFL